MLWEFKKVRRALLEIVQYCVHSENSVSGMGVGGLDSRSTISDTGQFFSEPQ